MSSAPTADNITATIQGENRGQMAVGKHIVQVHADAGAIVNVAKQGGPDPAPCATPVIKLPSRGPTPVGRREVVDQAKSTLTDWNHCQLYGEPEIGKTSILKHFCHLFEDDQSVFTDGIVYVRRKKTHNVDDVLQLIFDAFYRPSEPPFRPNASQFTQFMQDKRALIVVDDADLDRDDIEDLLNAAPNCAFLLTAQQRNLWSGGEAIEIEGLPPDAAISVVEAGLKRELVDEEREAARELCDLLAGRPLRLLEEADKLRKGNQSVVDHVAAIRPASPPDEQAPPSQQPPPAAPSRSPANLTGVERDIATVAASLNGELISSQHLLAVAKLLKATEDAGPGQDEALATLQAAGHIFSGSGFCVKHELLEEIKSDDPQAVTTCRQRILEYFTKWADEHRDDQEQLLADAEPMLEILNWAVQSKRWQAAMDLALILEHPLMLSKRWGSWKAVLETILQASQGLGDRRREAWALHQLGTLRFARAERRNYESADLLDRARVIREELDDPIGVAISGHNLGLARPWLLRTTLLLLVMIALMAIASGVTYWLMRGADPHIDPSIDYTITLAPMSAGTSRTSQIILKEPAPKRITVRIESPSPMITLRRSEVSIPKGEKASSEFTYEAKQPLEPLDDAVTCILRVSQIEPQRRFLVSRDAEFAVQRSTPRVEPTAKVDSITFSGPDSRDISSGIPGGKTVVCKIQFDRSARDQDVVIDRHLEWRDDARTDPAPPDLAKIRTDRDWLDDRIMKVEIETRPVGDPVIVTVQMAGDPYVGQFTVRPPAPIAIDLPQRIASGDVFESRVTLDGIATDDGVEVSFSVTELSPGANTLLPDGTVPVAWYQPSYREPTLTVEPATVKAGTNTAKFTIRCPHVADGVEYQLKAESEYGEFTRPLKVEPARLDSVVPSDESVTDGGKIKVTVKLDGTAPPPRGASIELSFPTDPEVDRTSVDPNTIVIKEGEKEASEIIQLPPLNINKNHDVRLVASYAELTRKSRDFTIIPPPLPPLTLADFTLTSNRLTCGGTLTGSLSLNRPAPDGGAQVLLTVKRKDDVSAPEQQFPRLDSASKFDAGQTVKHFEIRLGHLAEPAEFVLTARDEQGTSIARSLGVEPNSLTSFALTPSPVRGGELIQGTLTLDHAPCCDVKVGLEYEYSPPLRDNQWVLLNPPAETHSLQFDLTTNAKIEHDTDVTVTATLGETERQAKFTVLQQPMESRPRLTQLTVDPSQVPFMGQARGRVVLDRPVTGEPVTVRLASSYRYHVRIPASVVIEEGKREAPFGIATSAGTVPIVIEIVATLGDDQRRASLTLDACSRKPPVGRTLVPQCPYPVYPYKPACPWFRGGILFRWHH